MGFATLNPSYANGENYPVVRSNNCRISVVILPRGDIISYMMVKWFASGISSYVTGKPYRARWPAKSAVCLRNSGSSALPTTSDSGFVGAQFLVEVGVTDRLEIEDA